MAWAHGEGVELYYETFGAPEDPPLLLIAGLGAQAIGWPDELCEGFVDRGFHVVRFDNRDVGLSTKLSEAVDLSALAGDVAAGRVPCGPYRLTDMALDAVAVLDAAGLDDVHLVGASMGGMIAQTMAIEHPSRVRTLTSIMSSTGEAHVGQPAPEVVELLAEPVATDREAAIAVALEWSRRVGSPDHADPDYVSALAGAHWDRDSRPGVARQLAAILASGSRADALVQLDVPTLVVHGALDRLIDPSGGERTAELVPGARFESIEGMGHDLPVYFWSRIIQLVTAHVVQAAL